VVSEVNKAYAAGIVDGEGCIYIAVYKNKAYSRKYFKLGVKVGMTGDVSCLAFLHSLWGGNISRGAGFRGRQIQWSIASNDASSFLQDIMPYLKLKKPQALAALKFQENKKMCTEDYGFHHANILKELKGLSYETI